MTSSLQSAARSAPDRMAWDLAHLLAAGCMPAPPGVSTVVRRLGRLLPAALPLAMEVGDIPPAPEEWCTAAADHPAAGVDNISGLHGYITKAPAYAAVFAQGDNPVLFNAQVALLAIVLVNPGFMSDPLAVPTLRDAGLFVRKLSASTDLCRQVQPGFPSTALPEQTRAALNALAETLGDLNEQLRKQVSDFTRLIEYGLEARRPKSRGQREPVEGVLRTPSKVRDADDEDATSATELYEPPIDRKTAHARKSAGAPVSGEGRRQQYAGIQDPQKPSARTSIWDMIRRVQGKARAMRTEAQMLPFASNRLQLPDLQALLGWVESDARMSEQQEGGVDLDLLRDVALLMLLCGKSADDAVATRVIAALPNVDALAMEKTPPAIRLVTAAQCLLVRTPVPTDRFEPDETEKPHYEPVMRTVILPIPDGISRIKRLLERAASRPEGALLFDADSKSVSKWLGKELDKLGRLSGARVTESRIGDFLNRFIVDIGGDRADGAFFSSSDESDGCAARLFYYAPPQLHLVSLYKEAWNHVWRGIQSSVKKNVPLKWSQVPIHPTVSRIGSAGVPRVDLVRAMVAKAYSDTLNLSRGRRSAERVVALHNQLTAYTVLMVLWSTGIRAIQDPIEIELLDLAAACLGISDKDADEYPDARVVWLVDPVPQQLRYYRDHRKALLTGPFASCILKPPSTWAFFIDDGIAVPVTPKRLLAALPDYPFRSNSQRHFIRTTLREKGVRAQAVDALLGHGAYGEQAYGPFSSYSPLQLREEISKAMTEIVNDLGWKAVAGLQADSPRAG